MMLPFKENLFLSQEIGKVENNIQPVFKDFPHENRSHLPNVKAQAGNGWQHVGQSLEKPHQHLLDYHA